MKIYLLKLLLVLATVSLVGCGGRAGSSDESTTTKNTQDESGSATLSWVAPSTRTDSSPLSMSDIAGYKVYIGTSATNLTLYADINDSTITEHTINNLPDGTHYFAISAYDLDDIESGISTVVSKTI